MIDTDKYEGHTRGPWNLTPEGHIVADDMTVVCNKHTKRIVETNHKDTQLIADAPLLLEEVKRLRKTNEFHMMLDAEETKEQLKLQKENDNLTKLCIERYAEVKRLREGIAGIADAIELVSNTEHQRAIVSSLRKVIE